MISLSLQSSRVAISEDTRHKVLFLTKGLKNCCLKSGVYIVTFGNVSLARNVGGIMTMIILMMIILSLTVCQLPLREGFDPQQ